MMNKRKRSLRPIAATAIVALAAIAGNMLPTTPAQAQDAETREKIRLMASALRARNDGDLLAAKAKLEELIVMAPEDTSVQRLLASVNDALDAQYGGNVPQWAASTQSVDAQPVSEPTVVAQADSWDFSSTPESSKKATASASSSWEDSSAAPAQPAATYSEPVQVSQHLPVAQTYPVNGSAPTTHVDYAAIEEIPDSGATKTGRTVAKKEPTLLDLAKEALEAGNIDEAFALIDSYEAQNGFNKESRSAEYEVRTEASDPTNVDIRAASPGYVEQERELLATIAKGRAQYIAGDYQGAVQSFNEVETVDPDNREAKHFLRLIALERAEGSRLDVGKTRAQMLQEVSQNWQRPRIYDRDTGDDTVGEKKELQIRMESITIPEVKFSGTPITQVAATLSALAEEVDGQGINIIVLDPSGSDPSVNISLKNLKLDVMLGYICRSINYGFAVEQDAVVLRPGSGTNDTITEFYSITRPQIIRMIGAPDTGGGGASNDPFAPAPVGGSSSSEDEAEKITSFLERAGVQFSSVPNATLAMGDGELIITNTPENHDRIIEILRRFSEVKQVEIEAKFLEVQQGDLEELGVDWSIAQGTESRGVFNTSNRSVSSAFSPAALSSDIVVSSTNFSEVDDDNDPLTAPLVVSETSTAALASNSPPILPNVIDLASDVTTDLFSINGILGSVEVGAVIRALSRKEGTDLMSAPKVTVLSGKTAEIVVAQELRYPESYSDIEAEVSEASGGSFLGGSGGASVAITAGTPQDFVVRNIGVEMEVVPTVEKDNRISLQLEPQVTEFEGFVEYGGPSIAIAGGTTVTVPAGFYQPVFSVRRVRTEVTVWDGATVVLGGLTREEIVYVNDRVPVLGDVPLLGRLFRNEGESSQKRNLLIFVSANLVSPGGSPSLQEFNTVNNNTLFQNPTIVTPGGALQRSIRNAPAKASE